jgi:hypothetical protein
MNMGIKLAFELTRDKHHKDFRQALEAGALAIIADVDPVRAAELRIEMLEQELNDEKQKLANYQLAKQLQKTDTKKQSKTDNGLEKIRLEKFEKWKESLAMQVENGRIDWKQNMNTFLFNSPTEASDWILAKLKEADLLD